MNFYSTTPIKTKTEVIETDYNFETLHQAILKAKALTFSPTRNAATITSSSTSETPYSHTYYVLPSVHNSISALHSSLSTILMLHFQYS